MGLFGNPFKRRYKKIQKTSPSSTIISEDELKNIQDAVMMSSAVAYDVQQHRSPKLSSDCDNESCGSCGCDDSDGFDD